MASHRDITPKSAMQEILQAYPSAQRALFAKYHIGGCSSCGFQPTDTLEDVIRTHGVANVDEVIGYIKTSDETARRLQVEPDELAKLLQDRGVRLLDLRSPAEHQMVHLDGDLLATQELSQEIFEQWPKETPIVLYDHFGTDSVEAVQSLAQRGFTNVRCLRGGIDAWSSEVDPLVPRYQ